MMWWFSGGRHAHASRVRGRSTADRREARKGGATAAQLQVVDEPDGEFEKERDEAMGR